MQRLDYRVEAVHQESTHNDCGVIVQHPETRLMQTQKQMHLKKALFI